MKEGIEMTKFKIGDKVRVLTDNTSALKDDDTIFSKGDIGVITEVDSCGVVRISNSSNSWIDVDDLELVEDENKTYTKEDIYEGMVLECVKSDVDYWTVGKQYIVDKHLAIQDDDLDVHWHAGGIVLYLNSYELDAAFKVLEPKKSNYIAEEYVSMPRLKGANIESPIMSSIPLIDHNMIVDQEHYINNNIQPIEIMKANFTKEEYRGFLLGNIVKYPLRYKDKNGLEDLKKTHTYITWLIQDIEERDL